MKLKKDLETQRTICCCSHKSMSLLLNKIEEIYTDIACTLQTRPHRPLHIHQS